MSENENVDGVVNKAVTKMNQEFQKQKDKLCREQGITDKLTGKVKDYAGGAVGAGVVGAVAAGFIPVIGWGIGFVGGATGYIAYRVNKANKRRKGQD